MTTTSGPEVTGAAKMLGLSLSATKVSVPGDVIDCPPVRRMGRIAR